MKFLIITVNNKLLIDVKIENPKVEKRRNYRLRKKQRNLQGQWISKEVSNNIIIRIVTLFISKTFPKILM